MITLPYTDTIQRQAADFRQDLADAVAGVDRCKGCHLPFQDCRCSDLVAAGVVPFERG